MLHGILVINKERGLTSHKVVAEMRRILKQKEIGHTGTLDPEATGVLVVGLGNATRSFSYLDESAKVYRAELIFGRVTDTQDATGKVLAEDRDAVFSLPKLEQAMGHLSGEIAQIPPMFSAVKVQGRKLYDLARQGLEVERQPRTIKVGQWKILNPGASRFGFLDRLECEITCSKGTYIRTLIHDLGQDLGCGAHMGKLTRLKSGPFQLEDAVLTDKVRELFGQGRLTEILVSLNTALSHLTPIWIQADDLIKVKNGGKLSFEKYAAPVPTGTFVRVLNRDSDVIAIAQLTETETHSFWQPIKVFSW